MIPIRSIMKKDFSKLSSSESVGAAVKVMEKMNVDYSLVEEEGEIKGIVTSRELVGYPLSQLLLDCHTALDHGGKTSFPLIFCSGVLTTIIFF